MDLNVVEERWMKHFVHFVPAERFFFKTWSTHRRWDKRAASLFHITSLNMLKSNAPSVSVLRLSPSSSSSSLSTSGATSRMWAVEDTHTHTHTHTHTDTNTLTQPFVVSSSSPSPCSHVLLTSFLQLFLFFFHPILSLNTAAALPAAVLTSVLLPPPPPPPPPPLCLSVHSFVCLSVSSSSFKTHSGWHPTDGL